MQCELADGLLNAKFDKDLILSQIEDRCVGQKNCTIGLREQSFGPDKDQSIESMVSDFCLMKILGSQKTSI